MTSCVFISIYFKILLVSLDISLTHVLFLSWPICCLISTYVEIFQFYFFLLLSSLTQLWSESRYYVMSIYLNFLKCFMLQNVVYLDRQSCKLEKNVDEVNRCPLYPVNWWCSTMSLLIFYLLNLLISDRWVLKSPATNILVDSSISSCSVIHSCRTYFDSVLLCAYTLRIVTSSWRIDYFSLCNVLFNPDNFHCFEVFFVWNYYCYSGFLLSCINIVYLSLST